MNKNNVALLLFSRSASAEAVAKPLAFGKKKAQSVASFMVNHARDLAAKTDLPVYFYSEKEQRGDTFGARFANAFEAIFALGFQHIIAIGNDCLTLTADDILTASKSFLTTPSVFGKATDGGAYLVGLSRAVFQKEAFQNIRWQSDSTFSELVQFVENQSFTTLFLSNKSDIDSVSKWSETLKKVSFLLRKKILQLLNLASSAPSDMVLLPINQGFLSTVVALRAPPISK
jgi:uncharacterized protein